MNRRLAGAFLLFGVACSAARRSNFDDPPGPSTTGSGDVGGGDTGAGGDVSLTAGVGGGTSTASGTPSDCSEAAKLVYLLTDANEIYSFAPLDKKLTKLGNLSCPTRLLPNSMAVSRDAVAWVNYVDGFDLQGAIFRVDLANLSCESAPAVQLPGAWARLGMGFSSDAVDTDAETLFVAGIASGQLGRINGKVLEPVGNFTGGLTGKSAELTGTGDARLFGFFTTSPVVVAELGKTNAGALSNVPLPTVEVPNAYAFSFWGGDFYLYTASFTNSRVNRYRPSDGTVDTAYIPDTGMRIVGAGVSTCAPVESPQ